MPGRNADKTVMQHGEFVGDIRAADALPHISTDLGLVLVKHVILVCMHTIPLHGVCRGRGDRFQQIVVLRKRHMLEQHHPGPRAARNGLQESQRLMVGRGESAALRIAAGIEQRQCEHV